MTKLRFVVCLLVGTLWGGCEPNVSGPLPVDEAYIHVRPAWSADGQYIAFTDNRPDRLGIYIVDSAGTTVTLVHAGDALGVTWSPDGQYIAYQEGSLIYRTSVSVDSPELLVTSAPSVRPSWSPDGTRLAYVRNGIRVRTFLTGDDQEVATDGSSPSWRPNGSSLFDVLSSIDPLSNANRYRLFIIEVGTSGQQELFSFLSSGVCRFFSLSPDGVYAFYSQQGGDGLTQIRGLTMLSGVDFGLTTDGGENPALSADGAWIAYTRTASGDGGIWKMRIDGTEAKQLTRP